MARRVGQHHYESQKVGDSMTRPPRTLDDDGKVVGILSLGDLALARDPKSALGDISAATPNT